MNDFTKAVITEIKEEAKGTRSFYFDIPGGMAWDAGSDMHFAHPDFMASGSPDKAFIRHMSLTTLPGDGKIGFTTRVPGSGSVYKKKLETLVPGDEMVMFKLGNRIPLRREGRPVALISMGVGVAAMRPMVRSWLNDRSAIPAMTNLVVDKKDQLAFKGEWGAAAASGLIHVHSDNRQDFSRDFESIGFGEEKIFYIVGSDPFLVDVIKRLRERGIAPENIELDKKPERKAQLLAG